MQEKAAGKSRNLSLDLHLKSVLFVFAAAAVMIALSADLAEGQSYVGVLELDGIPSAVQTGSQVTFSGSLTTASGLAVIDAVIYIKDDVNFGRDKIIGTLRTDDAGRFYGTWTAQPRSSGAWDFYAVYEGGGSVSEARSQTETVTEIGRASCWERV